MCSRTANFFHVESIGAEKALFLSLLIVRAQIKTSENILPHGYGVRMQISLINILKTKTVVRCYLTWLREVIVLLLLSIQVLLSIRLFIWEILWISLVENSERSAIPCLLAKYLKFLVCGERTPIDTPGDCRSLV